MTNGSYLGYPRINFAGHFRADTDTRNNIRCNYRTDHDVSEDTNADWGFNGTNEFQFFENIVTSVSYLDGSESTDDTVIGKHIVGNLQRPFSKLTDMDTDAQDRSTIYGMKFGITWDTSSPAENMRFFGDWTPSVIAQDMWPRVKCYSEDNHGNELYQDSFPFGASGTTVIDNVDWSADLGDSTVLQQLKTASEETADGKLSVRVALFFYTRNLPSYVAKNATLGYVIGSIGVPSTTDTLNVGGQRVMIPTGNTPIGMTFEEGDLCYNQDITLYQPWMSKTPFEIDSTTNKINVDLSNALPTNFYNSLRDIGNLQLGIIFEENNNCVQLIGDEYIPYLTENWLEEDSGIYTIDVTGSEVEELVNSKLVIVQVVTSGGSSSICGATTFSGASTDTHSVEILLEESPFFIRPSDYYVGRLSAGESLTKTLYVTYFGQPYNGASVGVALKNNDVIPSDGIVTDGPRKVPNSDGYVSFTFTNQGNIPYPREYPFVPCEDDPDNYALPIEGQVYYFQYAICSISGGACGTYYSSYAIAILGFSNVAYTEPYNWVDHVKPILAQYAQVVPIMSKILDMGSYADVTKPHNKELMILSLGLDIEDPGHMPTTRDLSPTKRDMILSWLSEDVPRYDAEGNTPPSVDIKQCTAPMTQGLKPQASYFDPQRCETSLDFTEHPKVKEPFFGDISNITLSYVRNKVKELIKDRPLIGLRKAINDKRNHALSPNEDTPEEICNVTTLQEQLQTAISLEFSTLPTYLTALYSIVEGCNQQIYDMIRSVVIQEMLHMTQAANTLIALGGSPQIDSTDCVHQYPTGLPGGVLPGLVVTLEKLSLEHVYDVFMAIEVPQQTEVVDPPVDYPNLYTIGAFYEEITDCIEYLYDQGEDIFDPDTVSLQVQWPYDPASEVGDVVNVTDTESALFGIQSVVVQGEGEGLLDPTDLDNDTIAHFFKFEGIVCQNHLEQVSDTQYEYSGIPIPFNPEGVWNMRNNPSASDIDPGTNCYTEARAFHEAFRSMLRSLQEVFNGSPEKIDVAVEIMESMQVHAKKTMWTKFKPHSIEMCGPVWDYEWPEL